MHESAKVQTQAYKATEFLQRGLPGELGNGAKLCRVGKDTVLVDNMAYNRKPAGGKWHFFKLRCSPSSEREVRSLAKQLRKQTLMPAVA